MLTLVAFVVLLGILVLVHEWGHFVAAKRCGVRVDVFSIGFGPRIWGWKSGPTDYRLSALPLGGYVKMAGDNPLEERAGAPDEFLSRPRWQRAIIALAGPTMNVLLAIVLLIGMFTLIGIPYAKYLGAPVQIAGFGPDDRETAKGLQPGDKLLEFDNLKNPTWEQALTTVRNAAAGEQVSAVVERDGESIPLLVTIHEPKDPWKVFGDEPEPAIIEEVGNGTPASRGGIKRGDRVVSVDGMATPTWESFTRMIKGSQGHMLALVVNRNGEEVSLQVQPERGRGEDGSRTFLVGVQRALEVEYRPVPFQSAIKQSFVGTWRICGRVLGVVAGLIQGNVSMREMGGPLEIARQSGRAASEGFARYVELMVLISLNLAILNLLPIPILDGGHILLLMIEGTIRRDLSLRVKERFLQVGLVFLLLIFGVVMFNDVVRIFFKG